MAVTGTPYLTLGLFLTFGNLNFFTNPVKAALFKPTYVLDQINDATYHQLRNDNEIDDHSEVTGGYVWGGVTMAVNAGFDSGYTRVEITTGAPAASWDNLTADIRFVVLYMDNGGVDTPLIGLIDLGETKSPNGEAFSVTLPGNLVLAVG